MKYVARFKYSVGWPDPPARHSVDINFKLWHGRLGSLISSGQVRFHILPLELKVTSTFSVSNQIYKEKNQPKNEKKTPQTFPIDHKPSKWVNKKHNEIA